MRNMSGVYKGAPFCHQITQMEQSLFPVFLHKGEGKSSFWKASLPLSLPAALSCQHLQPCWRNLQKEIKQEKGCQV